MTEDTALVDDVDVWEGERSPAFEDRQLVDDCLSGSKEAWETLYRQHHTHLLRSIRYLLDSRASDPHLVEEIGARVWYAIVSRNGRLLARFDPLRGCRLSTFLAVIARGEYLRFCRSERRRQRREQLASKPNTDKLHDSEPFLSAEISEFLESLTPREREFCVKQLLSMNGETDGFSKTNAWQLRCRIRTKLRREFA